MLQHSTIYFEKVEEATASNGATEDQSKLGILFENVIFSREEPIPQLTDNTNTKPNGMSFKVQ